MECFKCMRSKIILISILIFLSASAFTQTKETPQIFEKNIDLPAVGCFGNAFIIHTNYSLTLFPDSTFRFKYTNPVYEAWRTNETISGKYFIVNNTVHFLEDSPKGISSLFEFDTMELIDKKLIGVYKTGGSFELEESAPFNKFLEAKKSSEPVKGRKALSFITASSFSPQLSNKPNSF